MSKTKKITYWVATIWLALGMVSTGIVQLIKMPEEVEAFHQLGYPEYLLLILGTAKLLGVLAILIPKFPVLKEWAYAGFFFMMLGAIASHLISQDAITDVLPALLLLVLTAISWYTRPKNRKLVATNSYLD
ncbi:membrane protein [Marivirga lumbricoides]|uniref:Membrane protein n=1 Tax=Marivirga lumbricoides TaxID=1046115 RepID=A0ABQ1L8K5_9BACT|nr:membrane protein [Marivirga lumbricoides]